MSQSGALAIAQGVTPSNVPTSFVTDSGTAVPLANVLNVNGHVVAAGTTPFLTTGSGNNLGISVQMSQAIASTNASDVGLAAFNSSQFTVDANGFVSIIGAASPFSRFTVQSGTTPVVPAGGTITFNGSYVAAGAVPVQTFGTNANTVTLQVQTSQAIASTNVNNIGLAAFNSSYFTVDANGFVSLASAGPALTITGNSGGALPTSGNNWNILGAGSITTVGAGSTLTVELTGLTQYDLLVGQGTTTIGTIAPSATSGVPLISQGAAANPIFGTAVVAGGGTGATTLTAHAVLLGEGTSPVSSVGPNAASGIPLISQGAASDPIFGTAVVAGGGTGATSFTAHGVILGEGTSPLSVTAAGTNGQVLIGSTGADPAFSTITSTDGSITLTSGAHSLNLAVSGGTTTGQTITGNSGGALSPTTGNWNILGAGSITTVGSGSTLTVQLTGLTQYDLLVGQGSTTIGTITPSATLGVPLISQGAAANPTFGTAVVAGGGTGDTSFTPYAVITGGTTSTAALQNVSGLGSVGQVLTSNGAASLPTWQTAPSSTWAPNAVVQLKDDFIFNDGVFLPSQTNYVTSELTWYGPGSGWFFTSPVNTPQPGYMGIIGNNAISSAGQVDALVVANYSGSVNNSVVVGFGTITMNWVFWLQNLSNGTNRYRFQCGLATSTSSQTDGIYFQYSDNVNSGNWQGICKSASSTSTANSSTAASSAAYVNLGIQINAAGTSVSYYVNGVQIANSPLTTNIPSVAMSPFLSLTQISGTIASASVYIDLFYMTITLTTPR